MVTLMRRIEHAVHRGMYLGLQRLRHRPVGDFIDRLRQWERLDRGEFQHVVDGLLDQSLSYARENVPLYSSGPWREGLSQGDATRLDAWPVMDRQTVRANAERLHARRRMGGVFYRTSSASTGPPLRVAWNPRAAAWGWANEYRALLWHDVAPGTRTLLMWGAGHPLQDWVKNHKLFRTTELTRERLEEAAQFLLNAHPGLCQGLPSALTRLARHVRAHHPDAPAKLVPYAKVGGEQVYAFQREELHKQLGARVIETYGCTEVGPIAAECPAGSMHILAENVRVEIFRDDQPVSPGESGDIVVTSLCNRAMPLVRCKIGDVGRIRAEPCECGRPQPVLDQLIGRAADVFVAADGSPVHGSLLGQKLSGLLSTAPTGAIQQTLFVQVDRMHWKVLVESADGFDTAMQRKIDGIVRTTCGEACDVEIERVPLIPREPSGKYRYYRTGVAAEPR